MIEYRRRSVLAGVRPWLASAAALALVGCGSGGSASAPVALSWIGPGAVNLTGNTATAVEYVPGAFIEWVAGPCAGTMALACDVSASTEHAVATFRPFTVAGIKTLAFGLGYDIDPRPAHYMVSGQPRAGAGFTAVPGLEEIVPARGQTSTPLVLSLHALRWDGSQRYLSEACAAVGSCEAAPGGEDALGRAQLLGAIGYFKAPNTREDDAFGLSVALSADGGTLAVGAWEEDSSAIGAVHPGDGGYAAALASSGASNAGAAYVYRRSSAGQWSVEAYVKAPNADGVDLFGQGIALSADGGTLAVGAWEEDSSATGAVHPGDPDYTAALADNSASSAGAAYVYRRSSSGQWSVEAYVKAPNAGAGDGFGASVSLSADGDTLAVGARLEGSATTGAFHPDEGGYDTAIADNGAFSAGAAYVYRRSSTDRWSVEAYVKALNSGRDDQFGRSVALSADGGTLAVGASQEDSSATGAFHPGDGDYAAAVADSGASSAGATYVYGRSSTGQWGIEAYVKAPNAGENDLFGWSVALSANGDTLAVGAWEEGSGATGVFHPGDDGYATALVDTFSEFAGAVYIYRRSSTNRWSVEAYVKAPNAANFDEFGISVALSADGDMLAVGADFEASRAGGGYHPDDSGYAGALASGGFGGAGAAYVYSRSAANRWSVEAYIKAPNAEGFDGFGGVVALSADGGMLAVGAPSEDGSGLPAPKAWESGDDNDDASDAGAVYLY